MKFVTEMLEDSAAKYPERPAFTDKDGTVTYASLMDMSKKLGTAISKRGMLHSPVCIYMPKSVFCIEAMLAVVYSGNFYCVIDVEMPKARIDKIVEVMKPAMVITTESIRRQAAEIFGEDPEYVLFEEAKETEADDTKLREIREKIDPNELMFLLFTSGSTGIPKGVMISHRAEFYHVQWIGREYKLDDGHMILMNQAPLYFIMAAFDVYETIYGAGHCHLVPDRYFSFPMMLMNYLKEHRINTLNIVPSALCLVANFNCLQEVHLDDLQLVIFGGEVMPVKQLNMWIREYPEVQFADLYGATEVADTLTFYNVPGEMDESQSIPIGKTAGHMQTMILNEEDEPVAMGEVGELCATGPSLSDGYYGDPERTSEVFVPSPFYREGDPEYMKRMYRMGDLVKIREDGNMIYIGRKDFQIKHMGHRIELGEIEAAVSNIEGIDQNCCIHDKNRDQIVLFYSGNLDDEETILKIRDLIPDYMVPTEVYKLDKLPLTPNGKFDRVKLRKEYID